MSVCNVSRKIKILVLLNALAIIAISYMKSALELEDAEQAYYSQWWRLTYDDQPPLYTWFQIAINNIFGIRKFSFSLLRALIFSGTIGAVYFFGKEYLKDRKQAAFGVMLLVLIPVFIDFTFRRLSHTSLLCLAVLLTFILVQRLVTTKSTIVYILLGLVVSLGILTKYNYFLMLGAFVLIIPFNGSLRRIVFNKRILLTLLVVIILVFPHFYDLFSSAYFVEELHKSIAVKTSVNLDNAIPVFSSVFAFVKSFFNLILPLFAILGVLFWRRSLIFKKPTSGSWLQQLFVSQLVVFVLAFVLMNVVKVEVRWLLPLFLPYVILILSLFQINNIKQFINVGFYFFIFIVFVQTVRTPIEKILGISSSVHFGFNVISDDLNEKFLEKQWVLPDVTYGGNIRLLNPEREILALDDFTLPDSKKELDKRVVVRNKPDSLLVLETKKVHEILDFGKGKENLGFYLE